MAKTIKCHDQNVYKLFLLSIQTHRFRISLYNSPTTEHGRNLPGLLNSYMLKIKMRQKGKNHPCFLFPQPRLFWLAFSGKLQNVRWQLLFKPKAESLRSFRFERWKKTLLNYFLLHHFHALLWLWVFLFLIQMKEERLLSHSWQGIILHFISLFNRD